MTQRELPFAEAEGSRAERLARLGAALDRVACDKWLSDLCRWVFNATAGGADGALVKTYEEIRQRPWGLCCSLSKARSTVSLAVRVGLLAKETRVGTSGQTANALRIDWSGIARIDMASPSEGVLREQGGVLRAQGGVLREQGGVLREHPYKEIPFVSLNDHNVDDDGEAIFEETVRQKRGAFVETANEVCRLIWPDERPNEDDRRLVFGAAILAHTVLTPEWLLGAARATKRHSKESKRGFLWTALVRRCGEVPELRGASFASCETWLETQLARVRREVDRATRPRPQKESAR